MMNNEHDKREKLTPISIQLMLAAASISNIYEYKKYIVDQISLNISADFLFNQLPFHSEHKTTKNCE